MTEKQKEAPRLATAADFLKDYKTEQIEVEGGLLIQIRSLPAADMLIGFGGMLALEMRKAGQNPDDPKAREAFIEALDDNTAKRLMHAQREGIKENVCKAVESLEIVQKAQVDCGEGELSVDSLSKASIWHIYRRVRVLAGLSDPGENVPEYLKNEPSE
ncbi:MAG: hypothetical protein OXI63_22050 [Candidatus Poribacteria bacterium]|nr:hypothetical protein [Candidatus Poribacteria bacterium]